MEVTLAPTLSDLQKSLLRDWLQVTLNDDGLNNTRPYPLHSAISLYIDGSPRKLQSGTWAITTDYIWLAKSDTVVPMSERLPILLTLSQLCEPSEELTKACSGAIIRYLLGEYRSLSSNLVVSTVTPSGIAFSTDNRIASLLGTEWMLPSGEVVDVSSPDWVVCASGMPVRVEPVELIDGTPVTESAALRQFRVGDRVSYTEIPGVVSPRERETGVVALVEPLQVRSDVTGYIWAFGDGHLLTLIEPPINSEYQFSVGQRVHWTPNNSHMTERYAVVEYLPDDAGNYLIRDDSGTAWAASQNELRAI